MGLQWSSQPDCPELLLLTALSSFGKCISGSFYVLWLLRLPQQEGNLSQVTALGAT